MNDEKDRLLFAIQNVIDQLALPVNDEEAAAGWDQDSKTAWAKGFRDIKKAISENKAVFLLHGEEREIRFINVFRDLDYAGISLKGEIVEYFAKFDAELMNYYGDE